MKKYNVIVIGGGPAGILAAYTAASMNKSVILLEKNQELGKKLAITGGGRCNITNNSEPEEMISKTISNGKFLYSAFNEFTSKDLIKLVEDMGIPLKTEGNNKVFPVSNRSNDIIEGFYKALKQLGVEFNFSKRVLGILVEDNSTKGVRLEGGVTICGESIILATGGKSYPFTGSTGDGYQMAEELGHTVNQLKPGLVPINIKEDWIKELMGISLSDAIISFKGNKKTPIKANGPIIFTHFGLSGPAVLELSSHLNKFIYNEEVILNLDLLPDISEDELERLLMQPKDTKNNYSIKKQLNEYLPKKLLQVLLEEVLAIDGEKTLIQITREERLKLIKAFKSLELTATGLRGLKEAIITSGGISIKEIDPRTMKSKLINGLYFAGEIIDTDAVTGGYNLHIAFSTGYLAGLNA